MLDAALAGFVGGDAQSGAEGIQKNIDIQNKQKLDTSEDALLGNRENMIEKLKFELEQNRADANVVRASDYNKRIAAIMQNSPEELQALHVKNALDATTYTDSKGNEIAPGDMKFNMLQDEDQNDPAYKPSARQQMELSRDKLLKAGLLKEAEDVDKRLDAGYKSGGYGSKVIDTLDNNKEVINTADDRTGVGMLRGDAAKLAAEAKKENADNRDNNKEDKTLQKRIDSLVSDISKKQYALVALSKTDPTRIGMENEIRSMTQQKESLRKLQSTDDPDEPKVAVKLNPLSLADFPDVRKN